jgi:hypothetical protein
MGFNLSFTFVVCVSVVVQIVSYVIVVYVCRVRISCRANRFICHCRLRLSCAYQLSCKS